MPPISLAVLTAASYSASSTSLTASLYCTRGTTTKTAKAAIAAIPASADAALTAIRRLFVRCAVFFSSSLFRQHSVCSLASFQLGMESRSLIASFRLSIPAFSPASSSAVSEVCLKRAFASSSNLVSSSFSRSARGATRLSSSLVAPLPASVCRPTAYFPNIFEKNPCFLTFSSRRDPSRFASACGAPPLSPLPPMRTISCKKGDFT